MQPIEQPTDLECHPLCLCIPEMDADEYEELRLDIECVGLKVPIVLFEGMILDGRHRYRACVETGAEMAFEEFTGPGSAFEFVVSHNLKRRNLAPEQRLLAVSRMTEVMKDRARARQLSKLKQNADGDRLGKFTQTDAANVVPLHTREELARAAGVSGKTASDFIAIKERGTQADLEEVIEKKASISGKAKEVRRRETVERAKPKPAEYIMLDQWKALPEIERNRALTTHNPDAKLNKQDNESIGWAKYSWNPVTGCKHNCPYCYARDIAGRFYPQGFEPSLLPSRLSAPQNEKPRASDDPAERNIFTCSMADLFGRWVPEEWIDAVMRSVHAAPQWNFLFLTKFPNRMIDRELPDNVWLGTSVDLQARVAAAEKAFDRVPAKTRWLSIEPLIEPLTFARPDLFQWVVIGGASRSNETPEWQPQFEWVARLYLTFKDAGARVYIKDNIGFNGPRRPREYPWQQPEMQSAADVFHYLKNRSDV
jgi:protein gp37